MSETIKLPELPAPDGAVGIVRRGGQTLAGHYYVQEKVRAFARLAVEQATADIAQEATALMHECAELRAECDALRAKYDDLILSVGNKCPGESRHETAKRYIYQAERADSNQKAAALKETKE